MKWKGLTDTDDYHPTTLWWYIYNGHWQVGWNLKNWGVRWYYVWYDGPNWYLQIGPFWWGTL